MADNYNDEKSEPPQLDTAKVGFGSFKVMLADILTLAIVIRLATFFEYPPRITDELKRSKTRNHEMISHMEERGEIKPTDITSLLNGLRSLDLVGTESTVRKLFEDHTGVRCTDGSLPKQQREGKISNLVSFLQKMYARWYNKIQPIPYIREKVYCVNDVYVESGIKVSQSGNHLPQNCQYTTGDEPKSFSDIFDSNKISSNRILLEGDPGYGKSTFTLQAAYEWCLGNETSNLKMFQVFILLPLRLLGNICSIFTAIRLLLVPDNVDLTDDDIKQILNNCSSGVIVLDGYDEYPDKDRETDVIKIIEGKMFPNFKVVLTSRPSSLPRDLDPSTVMIRFTGFDDTAMYEYIKRAVTGGNEEEANKIKDILNSSSVLADICQIPIFCVLFAHITKEQTHRVTTFNSVTSFFKYIISCFYIHMRNKYSRTRQDGAIPDYESLNKLAFDSLVSKSQQLTWSKNTFIEIVGPKCYNELLAIGILIEETILTINDEPGVDVSDLIKYQEFVRFYHKLFAEWYAANYLSSYAGGFWPIWLNNTLKKINPVDLQYVFRFASGLNKKACNRVVGYLKRLEGGKTFASLCLFEQTMDEELLKATLRDLLSDVTNFWSSDSKLLQRSNIQLLEFASRNGIPIFSVWLGDCSPRVSESVLTPQCGLILQSGLSLSILSSLQRLNIGDYDRRLTTEEFVAILGYASQCTSLKELMFWWYYQMKSVPVESIPSSLKSRQVKVWIYDGYDEKYHSMYQRFNLTTGRWQNCDLIGNLPDEEGFDRWTWRSDDR